MEKFNVVLYKSIASGLLIALAGSVYLSVDNKYLGALLFSFGLLVICNENLNLYTGKVGYLFNNLKSYWSKILIILLGNIIGILIVSLLVYISDLPTLINNSITVVNLKLNHKWYEVLALSIPCGMLMYIAVEGFRTSSDNVIKTFVVIMAVMIFIIVGFEHSIANLFYITISNMWSAKALLFEIIMIIGNAIGAILINSLNKKINPKRLSIT